MAFKNWEQFAHMLYPPGSSRPPPSAPSCASCSGHRHDGDAGEPPRFARAPAHLAAPGPHRLSGLAWTEGRHPRRAGDGAERRAYRSAGPRRVRSHRLRPAHDAQCGPQALRGWEQQLTGAAASARPAVLARLPRRTGARNVLLKVASAYESASHRRVPPPAFGPLPDEP